ncbi:MAG: DUF1294 domain-containing protein [Clostridiales bacterium]|nr:DUF1294 domain-containing protein [Clostridiales bacterium]
MIKFLLVYFACINIFAAVITVYDKQCAKARRRRIPEDFLLTVALLGGAAFEYITMKAVRHKTRHKKFMITLPVMIILQLSALLAVVSITGKSLLKLF